MDAGKTQHRILQQLDEKYHCQINNHSVKYFEERSYDCISNHGLPFSIARFFILNRVEPILAGIIALIEDLSSTTFLKL